MCVRDCTNQYRHQNNYNNDSSIINTCRNYSYSLAGRVMKATPALVIPIVTVLALSNLPTANAGPFAGGICLLACIPLIEAPPLLAVCLAACGIATTIPGP